MTWAHRPAGSLCVQCNYRPARPPVRFPERAALYCSDHCKAAACRRRFRDKEVVEADAIRYLLGLSCPRGERFTLPELRAIRRRILRLLPSGAMSRYPATRRSP